MTPGIRIPFRRQDRRRRWPWVVAVFVVLAIGGLQLVKVLVDADRYRPMLAERLSKATGLYTTIERVELSFFPKPNLHARNVTLGEDDFRAVADDVHAYPRIAPLLRRSIDITEVRLDGLRAVIPATPGGLKARVDAMTEARAKPEPDRARKMEFAVRQIVARDATVTIEGKDQPFFAGDLEATDVLSDRITIRAAGSSPANGPDSVVEGNVTLDRRTEGEVQLGVSGRVHVVNIDTRTMFGLDAMPPGIATLVADIERTAPTRVRVTLSGDAKPIQTGNMDLSAIAGSFSGVTWWDAGEITLNDLHWTAPGVEFTADATMSPDGAVAARILTLTANRSGIEALLSAQPSKTYRVQAREDATFTAQDVLVGMTEDKKLRLADGTASFSGVVLTLPDGRDALSGFNGELAFGNDAITIAKLEAPGLNLKGSVKPDIAADTVAADLSGTVELTRERLAMFVAADALKEASGVVTLKKASGTFTKGGGVPKDLSITGSLAEGVFALESKSWTDRMKNVRATFTATPGAIETSATAASEKLGAVNVSGNYAIDDRRWKGRARGNLARMNLPFLKQEAAKKVAPGIVAAYGDSEFAVALELPTEKQQRLVIEFDRDGAPELAGAVTMLGGDAGWSLGDVTVDATLPGRTLGPMLPEAMHVEGNVPVRFRRSAKEAAFTATIGLDENGVAIGDYLYKRPGAPAALAIDGVATEGNWAAKDLTISLLDEQVRGQFTESRFSIPQMDLNAAVLAALLPEGAQAGGRIRGEFATAPVIAALTLDNVSASLSENVRIERLHGAVSYQDGVTRAQSLEVRGANSDFTADFVLRAEDWSGALTGRQLDVNAVLALREGLMRAQAQPAASAAQQTTAARQTNASQTATATRFDINMGTVLFRNARLDNVFTNMSGAGGAMQFDNLSLTANGGSAKGWIRLTPQRGDVPATTAMSLALDGVDQSIIDEIALDTPRGLKGPMWGTVDLAFNTGEGVPALGGSSGRVVLRSKDGSFGKLGIATKVLSVLRTVEITRLRPPRLKDEGLTYDSCELDGVFNNGVLTVQKMDVVTPTYYISVIGTVNFDRNDCELLVHVDLLESVLGPAENVPGLNEVVGLFRTAGGLQILVTGPPADPSTSYAFGAKVNAITDEVRNTVKTGGNFVRDQILERAGEALRGLLNQN